MRYAVAACQTDFPCPSHRDEISSRVDRMLNLVDGTVHGYAPVFPIRLIVFPEFAHTAPIYPNLELLRNKLAVEIPNEHIERYVCKAKEHGIFIQTGSFIEIDPKYPGALFNTTCLVGPGGLLYRYRKVNPWIPWELHSSPHDIPEYSEEMFPVAQTEIGNIGCAICYDWIFPETIRQLAINGAEIIIRISAYMDPWGATPPMDWWTVVNRCRALENMAYVVAANQGASLEHYGPFSWPGGSMVVDYDGRILAQASPGPGEKIVVAEIDLEALREAREKRLGHNPLSHLRTEAYHQKKVYPSGSFNKVNDPHANGTIRDVTGIIQSVISQKHAE